MCSGAVTLTPRWHLWDLGTFCGICAWPWHPGCLSNLPVHIGLLSQPSLLGFSSCNFPVLQVGWGAGKATSALLVAVYFEDDNTVAFKAM